MPAAQLSTYKLIRNIWPDGAIAEQILKGSPIIGKIKKDTKFGEKIRFVTVGTSPPQGLGDFDNAKRNKTASTAEEFQIQLSSYFGNFSIAGSLWRRAEFTGNKALLKDPMVRESKGIMNQAKNDFASFIHGNGGGAIGATTTGSDPTTQTVTLTAAADKRRIVKGMTLWASTTDGTTGAAMNGQVTVASLAGTATAPTVTINEASWANAIPGMVTGTSYFLFRAGCFGNSTVFYGLDAWLPKWAGGTPSVFNGVTRANAAEQLAGINLDLRGKTPRQRVMLAAQAAADTGQADGEVIYAMNTTAWTDLYFELTAAGSLIQTKTPAAKINGISTGVEYDAIEMVTPVGKVMVVPDPWMPAGVERLLFLDTFTLASCGEWFHWDAGSTPGDARVEDAADSREVRAVGDQAMICDNPWPNVRVQTA